MRDECRWSTIIALALYTFGWESYRGNGLGWIWTAGWTLDTALALKAGKAATACAAAAVWSRWDSFGFGGGGGGRIP